MKTDSTQDLCSQWQQHIERWQQTHLSQAAYCKQYQLKPHRFSYWKRKLASLTQLPALQSHGFIQVVADHSLPSTANESALTIRLPGNSVIEGIKNNNVHLAVQLVRLLS
jgi:hypothetical protein